MITPVSIATTTATQTETEVFNSNIAATQTEAEEVNVRALLDKTEERLGEHILCSVQLPGQEQVLTCVWMKVTGELSADNLCSVQLPGQEQVIAIQRLLSVSQRQVVQGVLYYSALHFFFSSPGQQWDHLCSLKQLQEKSKKLLQHFCKFFSWFIIF